MRDELVLLLLGTVVALVSTIITLFLNSFIENRRRKREKIEEKEERAYHLMGRMGGVLIDEEDEQFSVFQEKTQVLDGFFKAGKHDSNWLSGFVGLLEATLEKGEKLKSELQEVRKKNEQLEAKRKKLEYENEQLEANRKRLENENEQLRGEWERQENERNRSEEAEVK